MSLKAFHLIFISAASLLCLWFAVWMWKAYQAEAVRTDLYYAVGAGVMGVALLVYEGYFLKKLKNVSYL
jgi:hypothetical protein